ncbi:hypothetical protein CHUAL_010149 [Chamberlinius hualienensis]
MARYGLWLSFAAGHHLNNSLLRKACQMSITTALVSLYTFIFLYLSVTSTYTKQDKSRTVTWLRPEQLMVTLNNSQLIDLTDFRYILQPRGFCNNNGSDIYFVVYVHSSPDHTKERHSIRSTWGSVKKIGDWGVKVTFLIGLTNDHLQQQLQSESDQHGDIVQGNFIDSYRNLSYKHLMGYKWILSNCPKTKFIVKVDDDSFVDIIQLYNLLHEIYRDVPSGMLACSVWPAGSAPQREPHNKWTVDYNEYPYDTYPAYCGGLAYVVSPDIARDLLAASLYVPFFWIDDLYVTGFLAEKIPHVRHHALNLRTTYDSYELLSWLRESASINRPCPYIFGDLNGSGNRSIIMLKMWKKTHAVWKNQNFIDR